MSAITTGILTSLAGRYAKALFDLSQSLNQVENVAKGLKSLHLQITTSENLQQILFNPTIKRAQQAAVLQDICVDSNVPELLQSFMSQLAQGRRLSILVPIQTIFEGLYLEAKNEKTVEVTSAYPLTHSQQDRLKTQISQFLSETTGIKPLIQMIFIKDPKVFGGLKVRIGSQIIDATVTTQLNQLATLMKGKIRDDF